jgi:acetyltransferase-like isoleucine patch superfamily enzyme
MRKFLHNLRKHVFRMRAFRGLSKYKNKPFIGGHCSFNGNTTLGQNCSFNGCRVLGKGTLTVGDNFHSGGELLIITSNHNFSSGSALPYDTTHIVKPVNIGDNVWIGERVTILPGVTIGEGAIVQAGSVVVRDIEPLAIVGGSPARKFHERDSEHYHSLKSQSKFH